MHLRTEVGALPARRRLAFGAPALLELAAVLAAIAFLMPSFARVAGFGEGRDQRYADLGLGVQGLPEPSLPAVCALHAAHADAALRGRLCDAVAVPAPAAPAPTLPAVLEQAIARSVQALLAPVIEAQSRVDALRAGQREQAGDVRDAAFAVAAVEAEIAPYLERYRLRPQDAAGLPALGCALRWAQSALMAPATEPGGTQAMGQANAVLLLAAAVDGRTVTERLARAALLPPAEPANAACAAGPVADLAATAAVMNDARQSAVNARKNEAMRALLPAAGGQWAAAMLLGYGLLLWSRRRGRTALRMAFAIALWTLAAWFARVPWPFVRQRGFEPARADPSSFAGPPAGFVLWLAAISALLLLWALFHRRGPESPAQTMSSRVGYAGLVVATGLGAVLLLDLSANGHPVNRYLALYHQGHLWLGMLLFSVLLFLRQSLSRGLGWVLSVAGEATRSVTRHVGRGGAFGLLLLATAAGLAIVGLALSNLRQLTSELGRIWLIVGASWFFFLRASPLAERLARSGPTLLPVGRYLWPLLFTVAVLVGAMFVTRDMGPLLIAAYASGAFLAASIATWWHLGSGRTAWPYALAVLLFAAWIGAVTLALLRFGSVDPVTSARLESLSAPLASTNDQAALVSWFQRATPPGGFGVGAAPWCGYAPAGGCSGVPAQVHSDYTFTAIHAVFGPPAAWAAALGCALWLHRLIRHHGRVTRGEPRLLAGAKGLANDGQALLSWVGVAWVVLTLCQLAVTVAGNLALLPLTGVTFPFVSFGMTSLLVNLAFLALCLNVDLPARSARR
jgi:cell division protein FtsW (lipid II flippase)